MIASYMFSIGVSLRNSIPVIISFYMCDIIANRINISGRKYESILPKSSVLILVSPT